MKLHSFIFKIMIFSVVLVFFVIPPVFFTTKTQVIFESWNFPFVQLNLFLFSIFLLYIFKNYQKISFSNKYAVFYKIIFPGTFCFCLLFCILLLTQGVAYFFNEENSIKIEKPQNFICWIYCILNFIFAAFYEESIYRLFLPEILRDFSSKLNKKLIYIIIEFIVCLSFAFAHFEYGIFSVLNAMLAHIVLRITFIKTGGIYAGFAAHFLYNLLQIILL